LGQPELMWLISSILSEKLNKLNSQVLFAPYIMT